jgi:hypothetical protein
MSLVPIDWQDMASLALVLVAVAYLARRLSGMMGLRSHSERATGATCGGCAGCGLRKDAGAPATLVSLGPPSSRSFSDGK